MSIFSTPRQLEKIKTILSGYTKLPFSPETIPGSVMEAVLANVHAAQILNTYDFVDVIKPKNKIGWQVKSTKAKTPVTWKRAKIPNAPELIKKSKKGAKELQVLVLRPMNNFTNCR